MRRDGWSPRTQTCPPAHLAVPAGWTIKATCHQSSGSSRKETHSCRAHWGLRFFPAPFPGQLRTVTRAWQERERPGQPRQGGQGGHCPSHPQSPMQDTQTAPLLLFQEPLRGTGHSSYRTRTPADPDPGPPDLNKDSRGSSCPMPRSGGMRGGGGKAGGRSSRPGPPDDWTDRVSGALAPSSQLWPSFLSWRFLAPPCCCHGNLEPGSHGAPAEPEWGPHSSQKPPGHTRPHHAPTRAHRAQQPNTARTPWPVQQPSTPGMSQKSLLPHGTHGSPVTPLTPTRPCAPPPREAPTCSVLPAPVLATHPKCPSDTPHPPPLLKTLSQSDTPQGY